MGRRRKTGITWERFEQLWDGDYDEDLDDIMSDAWKIHKVCGYVVMEEISDEWLGEDSDEDDKPDEPEVAAKPEQKLEPEPETETTEQTTIEGSDDHAPVKTVSIATQTDPEDADDLTAYKFTQDMMDRVEAAEDRTAAAESKLRALEKAIVDTNGWGDWVADLPDDVKESLIEAGYEHDDIYEEDSDEDDEQAECGTCGQKFDEDGNPVDGGMGCHKCCPSSEEDDSSEDDSSDSSDDY